jgi:hypothetical protein
MQGSKARWRRRRSGARQRRKGAARGRKEEEKCTVEKWPPPGSFSPYLWAGWSSCAVAWGSSAPPRTLTFSFLRVTSAHDQTWGTTTVMGPQSILWEPRHSTRGPEGPSAAGPRVAQPCRLRHHSCCPSGCRLQRRRLRRPGCLQPMTLNQHRTSEPLLMKDFLDMLHFFENLPRPSL